MSPSSFTRTRPSPTLSAKRTSRWPANPCTSTPNLLPTQGVPKMSVSVSMPQLGESVTEGTVTRWLKKEGEHVEADEPLLEVSTDKVDTEIPSPASGILRSIAVDEDETVAVGAQLAVIEESSDSSGGAAPETPAAPAAQAPATSDPYATPAAQAPSAPAAPAPAPAAQPYQPAYQAPT